MNTRVAIHCEPDRQWNQWLWRAERFLQVNGIPSERVCSSAPRFWEQLGGFTHFICLWGQWDRSRQEARTILPVIEEDMGLRCYPDRNTCRMFDDKVQQSLFLQSHNLPTPRAWVFWEEPYALEWAATAALPVVFKLGGGAGSSNVQLVQTRQQLVRTIKRMFRKGCHPAHDFRHQGLIGRLTQRALRSLAIAKRRFRKQTVSHDMAVPNWFRHRHYAYFQEFLPGNTHDTRVTTVGGNAFGFRRENREQDFRASGSGICDYDEKRVDPRCVRMALGISRRFGFQTMAYDFLMDAEGNPSIVEFGYAFADWAPANCPGHWNAELEWQPGQCWPQQLLLEDFMGVGKLEVPPDLDRFTGYARFSMLEHVE